MLMACLLHHYRAADVSERGATRMNSDQMKGTQTAFRSDQVEMGQLGTMT